MELLDELLDGLSLEYELINFNLHPTIYITRIQLSHWAMILCGNRTSGPSQLDYRLRPCPPLSTPTQMGSSFVLIPLSHNAISVGGHPFLCGKWWGLYMKGRGWSGGPAAGRTGASTWGEGSGRKVGRGRGQAAGRGRRRRTTPDQQPPQSAEQC